MKQLCGENMSTSNEEGDEMRLDDEKINTVEDDDHQQEQVLSIIHVSTAWAYSADETKVIVAVDSRKRAYSQIIAESKSLFCVFGDICFPAEPVGIDGVFHSMALPHVPGFVNFYLSLDGYTPISQVLTFEYRISFSNNTSSDYSRVRSRLVRLLPDKTTDVDRFMLSSKTRSTLNLEKEFSLANPSTNKAFDYLMTATKSPKEKELIDSRNYIVELTLKSCLKRWLFVRTAEGCTSITILDDQGQGVIHMCSILGYTWFVQVYSRLGLLLDFKDAFGWTALHWAAFYGRKEMVAILLLEGADPSLVTDHPSSDFPKGSTAADIAAKRGHDGLVAYLAEKGLTTQFRRVTLSESAGSVQTGSSYLLNPDNFLDEQELRLKKYFAAKNNNI